MSPSLASRPFFASGNLTLDFSGELADLPDMSLTTGLLKVARAFGRAGDCGWSYVSTLVFKDGKVLTRLATGNATITVRRLERALAWFSDRWPDDAEWPSDVSRPEPMSVKSDSSLEARP